MVSKTSRWVPCIPALVMGLGLITACGDDDGDPCSDPCDTLGDERCLGTVLQQCQAAANDCQLWTTTESCADQGLVCLSPVTGPHCGMLCTDPCSTGMSRCLTEVWQTCEADQWGCMRWEDFQDCAATSLVCDDPTGDASCFNP